VAEREPNPRTGRQIKAIGYLGKIEKILGVAATRPPQLEYDRKSREDPFRRITAEITEQN